MFKYKQELEFTNSVVFSVVAHEKKFHNLKCSVLIYKMEKINRIKIPRPTSEAECSKIAKYIYVDHSKSNNFA